MFNNGLSFSNSIIMANIEFNGNGDSTKGIAIAFNQLCDDLEVLVKWSKAIGLCILEVINLC